ncbi:hypothetical protein Lser_V15G21625 [Lactuca serriola]
MIGNPYPESYGISSMNQMNHKVSVILLQREAKSGDYDVPLPDPLVNNEESKANGGDGLKNRNNDELSSNEPQTHTNGLFRALVISGYLKSGSQASNDMTRGMHRLLEGGGSMLEDKVSLLRYPLQRDFQLQMRSSAYLLSTTDCASTKHRSWPEDVAWHPHGGSLFVVYTTDGGAPQISVLNLNKPKEKNCVTFLEDKPHAKGIINTISFMPWEERWRKRHGKIQC